MGRNSRFGIPAILETHLTMLQGISCLIDVRSENSHVFICGQSGNSRTRRFF
jgi:hypothetical protein